MATGRLTFGDYLREAFLRRVRLPLLGGMPVNLLLLGTFGVLGLANPGFWLLGAAVELGYLSLLASHPRFQKLIEGERLLAARQRWDTGVQQAMERLEPASRKRYRHLLGQCRRILGIAETLGGDTLGDVTDLRSKSLNQMLAIFLRLLTSKEVIEDNLQQVDAKSLEAEIRRLEERLAKVPEGDAALARSLTGTLEIRRRRLENRDRAKASLKVIEAELERIEQQVELIREEAAVRRSPEELSTRLDAVTATMTETSRWMDEHSDLLSPSHEGEPPPALPHLPELPEALEKE